MKDATAKNRIAKKNIVNALVLVENAEYTVTAVTAITNCKKSKKKPDNRKILQWFKTSIISICIELS